MKWIIYVPVHSSAFGPSRIHCGGRNAQIVTSYLSVFSKPDNCVYKYVCVCVCVLSHVQFFVTPWAVGCQAPLSMGFSRQEYWSGLPFPSLGHLPDARIKPVSPELQADPLLLSHLGNPRIQIYHRITCMPHVVTLGCLSTWVRLSAPRKTSQPEYEAC